MNSSKLFLLLGLIVIAGGGVIFAITGRSDEKMPAQQNSMESQKMISKEGAEMHATEMADTQHMKIASTSSPQNAMKKDVAHDSMISSGYADYSADKIAFAKTGKVILFFHAPWCPYCRAADADIRSHLSGIPSDTLILKTDYDSSVELKKKYGVTYQTTFVQVDAQGNMVTKWSNTETLTDILTHIK